MEREEKRDIQVEKNVRREGVGDVKTKVVEGARAD